MSEALDRAISRHRTGDINGARNLALAAIERTPNDSGLLHFLGMLERRAGNALAARTLLERAVSVDRANAPAVVSLARLLVQLEDWEALAELQLPTASGPVSDEFLRLRANALAELGRDHAAAADLVQLAERRPGDRAAALLAAQALAQTGRYVDAEAGYHRVLAGDAACTEALLGLVGLLESLNRPRDLEPVFARAREANADTAVLALGNAIALREAGRLAEALIALDAARPTVPEASWQQMRGAISDRLGDTNAAFSAFTEMNAADSASTPDAADGVRRYRTELQAELAALDMPRPPPPPPDARPAPVFLLGFPRSGTTLLDTFLMGHRAVRVHEERVFLEAAAGLGGEPGARASLDPEQVGSMRAAYWRALDSETDRPDLLQVDKNPSATARAALIDLLFAGAPMLFMLRHPCDVVLSCFITRFQLNWGVASFLRLEDTVAAYDLVMSIWEKARARRRLDVHEVRYEELIAAPGDVLRGIARFAGIEFDAAMLQHVATAQARGHITSPSHAQVAQPLYLESAGRWRRYRAQLAPYLPLLEPWCDCFGYTIED